MSRFTSTAARLVGEALGRSPHRSPFPWHEAEPLTELFGTHGLTPTLSRHELVFTGPSPAEYLVAERLNHPIAIAAFEVLQHAGRAEPA